MTNLEKVKENGYNLQHVKNQTPEICLAAVKQEGFALQHVKNQTPEICLAAVEQDGHALHYVKNQTEEICLAAFEEDEESIEYFSHDLIVKAFNLLVKPKIINDNFEIPFNRFDIMDFGE